MTLYVLDHVLSGLKRACGCATHDFRTGTMFVNYFEVGEILIVGLMNADRVWEGSNVVDRFLRPCGDSVAVDDASDCG